MNNYVVRERYFEDGNAVRKMAPQRQRPQYIPDQRSQRTNAPQRKLRVKESADRALAFDLRYTLFVISCVAIIAVACVLMLSMEGKISEQKNHINQMESELQEITDDNAAFKLSLESMYSLDDIYNVATNELGMVYAKKGQVVYYESANEDYVKQYQDIPE